MKIKFDEFMKIDLRTAKIVSVEDVPGKDRLYKIVFDLRGKKKQSLSGIKQHYSKKELIGKTVVIVANLEPATIAGFKSETMLLAADSRKGPKLVCIDSEVEPGTRVR